MVTLQEQIAIRKEKRRQSNCRSAQRSRQRKLQLIQDLTQRNAELELENQRWRAVYERMCGMEGFLSHDEPLSMIEQRLELKLVLPQEQAWSMQDSSSFLRCVMDERLGEIPPLPEDLCLEMPQDVIDYAWDNGLRTSTDWRPDSSDVLATPHLPMG